MYLKRLDVQGFKSFANKTALQFAPGVTCVVGPNGTGKTNVADALRWVLGEHASRTLRARKTEDVIFAGSDKRAPMGVAEVSLTLDNGTHWLPIEFDEVVVTRRAYRSGENEYLINNTKVRLRDVVDLFLRAQVGQNSYAFMGQGMVEQVLSLRPEDRRGLIEEAADVRLYRSKLEDAQHKLKQTRENVDRVRLLLREIEPRINQLERQAGRAVRYQDLAKELASALHAYYAHQWHEVNEAVLAAIATQDQRAEECERVQTDVRSYEDGLMQLRAAIGERRHEITTREGRMRNLQDYARDLERRVALDGERAKMLAQRGEELAAEIASLEGDAAAQAEAEPLPDTAELASRLAAAREHAGARTARVAALDAELLALQRAVLADEQAAARALAAVEDLSKTVIEAADTAARLTRERDGSARQRGELVAELAQWGRAYAHSVKELALLRPRLEWAAKDRERETAETERARAEQETLEEDLRGLRSQIDQVRVRLELMETFDVRPQSPDGGVRAILEAGGVLKRETVDEGVELGGVVGLVGQLVRVPSGLEKAIEAALAENMFAVVMERQADARLALNMLLAGDAGRATMYALDNLQEMRALHLIKEKGIVGVASGLVRCDSRYRRLIDTLLGRTVIVEDLATAHRIVRRGLAAAVATLDGVLVRPVGSYAAGSQASVEATFVREREVDDLPRELERLTPIVAEREAELRAAADRERESRDAAAKLSQDVDALRNDVAQREAALAASRAQLQHFRSRLDAHARSAAQAEERIARHRERREQAEVQREMRAAEAREASAREASARQRLELLTEEREAAAQDATEAVTQAAEIEGQLRSERQTSESARVAAERLARQIATKREQQAHAAEESRTVTTRLSATQRELTEKNGEVAAMREEIAPARQELAQLESRERELAATLAESNERLRSVERALVEAEHDARTRRDELETLRQSLEAEGFVASAAGEVERAPEPEPEPELELDGGGDYTPAKGAPPSWLRAGDGDLPPVRGGAAIDVAEVRDRIADLRAQIRALGPVNEAAATEYEESRERYDFLTGQMADLAEAEGQLNGAIAELETVIRDRFRTTFKLVNTEFERYFSAFFRGGMARLELGEPDEYGLPGIEIYAQPPGKKLGSLALLSGGERSLTAVALLFALLQANPSPLCVLDEVDAALDEANVGRFVEELRALSERTQFIIITHNRRTIETADTIYGVSMGADNVSRVLSLRLADVGPEVE
ncbi:MAG: chromosome segregation protein SMC [Chloroflexi bacterium]|nr:chromosome segregation protein SMC [Chloroflexota bacterium]